MNLRQKIEKIRMAEKEAVEKEMQEDINYILSQKESIVLNLEKILIKKWKTHADYAVAFCRYRESQEEQEIVKLYLNDNGFLRKKIIEMGFFPYYSDDFFL